MLVQNGRTLIGRFLKGEDLLLSISKLCTQNNIKLGSVDVIGALSSVKLGYYDQVQKKYVNCVELEDKLEINSCIGNISLKDSDIFVHAHITLADHKGKCYGGHLMKGSSIFAAEYCIRELTGGELKRTHDPDTGLSLW